MPPGVVVATKVDPVGADYSGARVRASVDESRARLGIDVLPLVHLHDPEGHDFADRGLRGIDSHGISMLMTYDRLRDSGRLNIDAPRVITAETPAVATIDAGGGLGHPVAVDAMHLAIDKARAVGIGAVAVRGSHHFGALGYYVRLAAAAGLMGFVTTSTRLTGVIPTGSRQSQLGTNPLAFAAPAPAANRSCSTCPRLRSPATRCGRTRSSSFPCRTVGWSTITASR